MDYQDFTKVCEEMQGNGQKVTLRTIQSRIGGSYSTLTGYLRQWKQETATPLQVRELSEGLRNALAAEFVQIEVKATVDAKASLERLETEVKELSGIVSELEEANESLKTDLSKTKTELGEARNELQITQDRLTDSIDREKKLEQDAADFDKQNREFIGTIARQEEIIKNLEKDNAKLTEANQSMSEDIEDLQQTQKELEKQRDIFSAKHESQCDRVKKLEIDLKEERTALKAECAARVQDLKRLVDEGRFQAQG